MIWGTLLAVDATVERDGHFWAENLPLSAGTNYLTLTATDAAGNSSETNITIVKGNVNLVINPSVSVQFSHPRTTVLGSIDTPGYTVWVNGVKATQYEDGSWEADDVPVTPGGTAVFEAKAIPNTDNGGNGTGGNGGASASYQNPGNPDSPQAQTAQLQLDKPAEGGVWFWGYRTQIHSYSDMFCDDGTWSIQDDQDTESASISFFSTSTQEILQQSHADGSSGSSDQTWNDTIIWPDALEWGDSTSVLTQNGTRTTSESVAPPPASDYYYQGTLIAPEHFKGGDHFKAAWDGINSGGWHYTASSDWDYKRSADGRMMYFTGGKAKSGHQNIIVISGIANEILANEVALPYYYFGEPMAPMKAIAPTDITIMGETLGSDDLAYKILPDGVMVDITAKVKGKDKYYYNSGASKYHPHITANGANLDDATPEFCVGQFIGFVLEGLPDHRGQYLNWNLPGEYVNEPYQYSGTCLSYRKNPDLLLNNPTSCWYQNKPGGGVSVGGRLYFENGKTIGFAAKGNIRIYRPQVRPKTTAILAPLWYSDPRNAVLQQGFTTSLALLDHVFEVTTEIYSQSPYSGTADYVQMISGTTSSDLIPGVSTGAEAADTCVPYGDTALIGTDYWAPAPPHRDGPESAGGTCWCTISDVFNVYLRFTPSGGIPITLARIDWSWNASAQSWTDTLEPCGTNWAFSSSCPIPTFDGSDDTFPKWTHIYTSP